MAAAAAINSSKKRKRPHSFETNPSIRRRQQTRLLRKLRQTIDEYATRVGQQAVVLIATPGKPQNNFRCFGAKPLEDVVKGVKPQVLLVLYVWFFTILNLTSVKIWAGFGNSFSSSCPSSGPRWPVTVRTSSTGYRWHPNPCREDDSSPAEGFYSTDAQILNRYL